MRAQLRVEVVGRSRAERVDPEVADAAVGEHLGADVLGADELTLDGQVECASVALDRQLDVGPARPADEPDGVADRQPGDRSCVDRLDGVAAEETSLGRGRVRQDVDDEQPAGVADRFAGLALGILAGHPRPDALELPGDVGQVGIEALGAHVGRVGVLERVEHRPDGRPDERLGVDVADEIVRDPVVGLGDRVGASSRRPDPMPLSARP